MSWSEIKHAMNSTLGTKEFLPVDKKIDSISTKIDSVKSDIPLLSGNILYEKSSDIVINQSFQETISYGIQSREFKKVAMIYVENDGIYNLDLSVSVPSNRDITNTVRICWGCSDSALYQEVSEKYTGTLKIATEIPIKKYVPITVWCAVYDSKSGGGGSTTIRTDLKLMGKQKNSLVNVNNSNTTYAYTDDTNVKSVSDNVEINEGCRTNDLEISETKNNSDLSTIDYALRLAEESGMNAAQITKSILNGILNK